MSAASIALPRLRGHAHLLRRRLIVAILVIGAVGALYMLWFRDSSLVAVKSVRVEGASDQRLRKALVEAGKQMTTLHVRQAVLVDAVKPFPLVESVSADPSFPSGLTIKVTERRPVAMIGQGDAAMAVAGDGTILRGMPVGHLHLTALPIASPPKGPRVHGPVLRQVEVLDAAPPALHRDADATFNGSSGLGVRLVGGIELRFGDATRAAAKWRAAAAVLSDPQLGPLDYVDLQIPGRPAVGGSGHLLP